MLGEPTADAPSRRLPAERPAARRRHRDRPGADRDAAAAREWRGQKFVEFYGEGLEALTVAERATLSNMSPEYGATCGFFPVDEKRSATSGRPTAARPPSCPRRGLLPRASALWRYGSRPAPSTPTTLVDRPRRRRAQPRGPEAAAGPRSRSAAAPAVSRPACAQRGGRRQPHDGSGQVRSVRLRRRPRRGGRRRHHLVHQHVEPLVMIGAGLSARNAVRRGLAVAALGQDLAGAGLASGDAIISGVGAAERRLDKLGYQPRRLRLHHLRRQIRSARPTGGQRDRARRARGLRPCSPAIATSKVGSIG